MSKVVKKIVLGGGLLHATALTMESEPGDQRELENFDDDVEPELPMLDLEEGGQNDDNDPCDDLEPELPMFDLDHGDENGGDGLDDDIKPEFPMLDLEEGGQNDGDDPLDDLEPEVPMLDLDQGDEDGGYGFVEDIEPELPMLDLEEIGDLDGGVSLVGVEPELPLSDADMDQLAMNDMDADHSVFTDNDDSGTIDSSSIDVFSLTPPSDTTKTNDCQAKKKQIKVNTSDENQPYIKAPFKILDWVFHKKYEEGKVTKIDTGKDGDVVLVRFLKPDDDHREHFVHRFTPKNYNQLRLVSYNEGKGKSQNHNVTGNSICSIGIGDKVEIISSRKFPNVDFTGYIYVESGTSGKIRFENDDGSYLIDIANGSSDIETIKTIRAVRADIHVIGSNDKEYLKSTMDDNSYKHVNKLMHDDSSKQSNTNVPCPVLQNYFKIIDKVITKTAPVKMNGICFCNMDSGRNMDQGCPIHPCRRTPIHDAAENGHDELVDYLIVNGADVNERDLRNERCQGMTPLHLAALNNHLTVVRKLIAANADCNALAMYCYRPLHRACSNGNLKIVATIADFGNFIYFTSTASASCTDRGPTRSVEISVKTHTEETPLHQASQRGHKDTVQLLLELGSAVNTIGEDLFSTQSGLHHASEKGHLEIAEKLIMAQANLKSKNMNRFTSVDLAFQGGNIRILDKLIACGAVEENNKYKYDWTPLQRDVLFGRDHVVKKKVKTITDVNAKDRLERTYLHFASMKGHFEIVAELIAVGADLNLVDGFREYTPLHFATAIGNDRIVEALVTAGCDVDAVGHRGSTTLHLASELGHEEIVEILITARCNVNAVNEFKSSALHLASARGFDLVVDKLLQANADADAVNMRKETPLYVASFQGYHLIVEKLLEAGAKTNAITVGNRTSLYAACITGHDLVVAKLIEANADVNAVCANNETALFVASSEGYDKIVNQLLQAGAYVNANKVFETPLSIAHSKGHDQIFQQLTKVVDKDAPTALCAACRNGQDLVVEKLIQAGFHVNAAYNDDNETALDIALRFGKDIVVGKLLQAGANVNVNAVDKDNETALHVACRFSVDIVVEKLLQAGAHVNAMTKDNNTALHFACRFGEDHIVVEKLLQAGAHVNAVNKDNNTALHEACQSGHHVVVEKLLQAGANVNAVNKDNETALLVACFFDCRDAVEKLLQAGAHVNATALHFARTDDINNMLLQAVAQMEVPPSAESVKNSSSSDLEIFQKNDQSNSEYGSDEHNDDLAAAIALSLEQPRSEEALIINGPSSVIPKDDVESDDTSDDPPVWLACCCSVFCCPLWCPLETCPCILDMCDRTCPCILDVCYERDEVNRDDDGVAEAPVPLEDIDRNLDETEARC